MCYRKHLIHLKTKFIIHQKFVRNTKYRYTPSTTLWTETVLVICASVLTMMKRQLWIMGQLIKGSSLSHKKQIMIPKETFWFIRLTKSTIVFSLHCSWGLNTFYFLFLLPEKQLKVFLYIKEKEFTQKLSLFTHFHVFPNLCYNILCNRFCL